MIEKNCKVRGRATGHEFGKSPEKKTDFVRVPFEVSAGPHAGDIVVWDGYFGENSTERTFESLRHCGCTFPNDDPTDLSGIEQNEVMLTIEMETYQDAKGKTKTVPRVAWVNALAGGLKSEVRMDAADKADFKERMRATMLAAKQQRGNGAAAPHPAPAAAPVKEDDIPF